jgi:hypothetical protein
MIGRKVCLWLSGPIATVIAVAETAAGSVYTVQFANGSTTRWAARHVMAPEPHPVRCKGDARINVGTLTPPKKRTISARSARLRPPTWTKPIAQEHRATRPT